MLRLILALMLLLTPSLSEGVNYCDDDYIAACYPIETGENTTLVDYSSNSNDGTFTASDKPEWSTTTPKSYSSYSLDFNGSDARITVPRDSSLEPENALSITLFFASDADSQAKSFVNKGYTSHSDPYYSYHLWKNSSTIIFVLVGASYSGRSENSYAIPSFSTGKYYHLAATYDNSLSDGERNKIYIDGSKVATNNVNVAIDYHATDLYIGDAPNLTTREFYGKMDEIGIFSKNLTSTEINLIINNGLYEATSAGIHIIGGHFTLGNGGVY